eukprot:TRINITY_DN10159_c0_g1_i1.p1 TRINITY_DN10159_c0_g1~~TRINITY_DN10159_c0_g1_i1.p1  ORF type:complete len:162 (-),score=33.11 TRINITY_DN10159_c0_g1_i1:93-578(-)
MDNLKNARNWYFFRQRRKRQKIVFQYQNQLVLKMISDLNYLCSQFNSSTHSLSIALSQKNIVYESLDKFKYMVCILQARIRIQQMIITNLKSQTQILQNLHQAPKISNPISISPNPIQTFSRPRRKKRRISRFLYIPSPNESPMTTDDKEELDLFGYDICL